MELLVIEFAHLLLKSSDRKHFLYLIHLFQKFLVTKPHLLWSLSLRVSLYLNVEWLWHYWQ